MKESIIVLGPPWSGKNTLTDKLSSREDYRTIDAGSLIRHASKSDNSLNMTVNSGNQIAPHVAFEIVSRNLDSMEEDDKVCINGFPRQKENAERLEDYTSESLISAFSLQASEHILFERQQIVQKRGDRGDDDLAILRTRLATYFSKDTDEVHNYYAKKGKLQLINAEDDPESIYSHFIHLLKKLRKTH